MAGSKRTDIGPTTVSVTLSHPHGDSDVGDRVDLERGEAKRLVAAGVALYSTKADAQTAEPGDRGLSKTVTAARTEETSPS